MKPTELVMLRNADGKYLRRSAYEAWEQGTVPEYMTNPELWTDNRDKAAVFAVEDAPPIGEGMRLELDYE